MLVIVGNDKPGFDAGFFSQIIDQGCVALLQEFLILVGQRADTLYIGK